MMKSKIAILVLRPMVILLKKLRVLSSISVRLTKLTGKSTFPVHPKHLISQPKWFLNYLKKTDTVLDLGSNDGSNTIAAAGVSKKVIGVDHSHRLLETAIQRSSEKRLNNVDFIQGDIEKKLPFDNAFFDAVLFLDVLEHINNEDKAMSEVRRVLKPNGRLFLSLPNSESSWKKLQRFVGVNSFTDPDHKHEYNFSSIKTLLSHYRFQLEMIEPVTFDTPFAPAIDLIGGFCLSAYKYSIRLKKLAVKKWPDETIGYQLVAIKKTKI